MTTLIFINFLILTSSYNSTFKQPNNDTIPVWTRQLYEAHNDELNAAIPVVTFFQKLSDSTSYCLYEVDDGVCHMTFVATQKYKSKYKRLKIGNECDEDFANQIYSSTTYKHDSLKRFITVTTNVEKAKSKYLTTENGRTVFKEGYNMENAETTSYSTVKVIIIGMSGNISIRNKDSR
jgi:dGTP triphosphohydrolase